jgi:hypothetical protein
MAGTIEPTLNGPPQGVDTVLTDLRELRSLRYQRPHLSMDSGKLGLVFACGRIVRRSSVGAHNAFRTADLGFREWLRALIEIDPHGFLVWNSPCNTSIGRALESFNFGLHPYPDLSSATFHLVLSARSQKL